MGNQAPPSSVKNTIQEVEKTVLAAIDQASGDIVGIDTDEGTLHVKVITEDGEALTDALQDVGTDQLRIDVENNNAGLLESADQPFDVSAAEVDIDIATQSLAQVATNLEQIGGSAQSAVDVADKIDQIEDALASVGSDSLLVDSNNALDVSATTVPVEQQTPVGVEDASGTQIDPDQSPDYPNNQTNGHDLIGSGDLTIGPVSVARAEALVISANSTDSNSWSASVDWVNSDGSVVYQTETKSDINLSSVTEDWSRLIRKGPHAQVTFTDESGAAQNNINAHVDTER
jgi:hypothetical protein